LKLLSKGNALGTKKIDLNYFLFMISIEFILIVKGINKGSKAILRMMIIVFKKLSI
jgi:hypothetical protein